MKRQWIFLALGVLAGIFLGVSILMRPPLSLKPSPSSIETEAAEEVVEERAETLSLPFRGYLAPDFELMDLKGETVRLSDFLGDIVLINFWATWCGPCRLEMSTFQARLESSQGEGFSILAVNNDEAEDDIRFYTDGLNLTFPILLDPGAKVQELYCVGRYPASYIVDRDGVIRFIHLGLMNEKQLKDYLMEIEMEL
ncbi:MAG TPA: redoxin domain-containing protein [Anaerolineae bacterium]|nr:redoxin domain-containing protein [Anaerolineae bacterium]